MTWQQIYDPFGNMWISTLLAAIPVVVMLVSLGFLHIKAHYAAGLGLIAAVLVAIFAYGMPADMAGRAALFGGFTGLLPIGWIVLNIIFLQQLAEQNGSFKILQDSLSGITEDRRLQLLLIAFCFGAFFEGAAGFGTPVAVTAGILIGLGFSPLAASGLSLIANTAPVAFGALGTPVITLAKVHGYDLMEVTAMIGRQLPFFLAAGAVLADLGVRGAQGDAGDLARDPGHRAVVRDSAVSGVELHRPRAGRHHRGDRLDGLSGAVPARLATEENLDLAVDQGPRQQRSRSQAAGADRHAQPRRPDSRVDTVGHPVFVRVRLGAAAGQGLAQRHLRARVPDGGAAQPDREKCRRWCRRRTRRRPSTR